MIPDVLRGDPPEFIALAAGEDGERDLFRLGGGEDEEHVLGRLLQRFQQRVEGLLREHVHFVDDVHLFPAHRGERPHRFLQGADLLDAAVRGGVDLVHVEGGAAGDLPAGAACIARIGTVPVLAVHRLGEDLCHTRFARAARAGEEVRMGEPVLLYRPAERERNVFLPHHLREGLGAPFAVQREICHKPFLISTIKKSAVLIYDSPQDAPWHMKRSTYCCFLSDLTGFMGFHCTGPGDCHKSELQSHVPLLYNIAGGFPNEEEKF